MTSPNQRRDPTETNITPAVISYRSVNPPGRRRWWAYLILTVYLLLVGALLAIPVWTAISSDRQSATIFAAIVISLVLCGLALIMTPVRVIRRRPIERRSILVPIIASGFLLGGLVFGGGIALAELWAPVRQVSYQVSAPSNGPGANSQFEHDPKASTLWMVVASAITVWIAWSIVFSLMSRQGDPQSLGMKLHRMLLAGSLLELVIAVSAHIIVRRRTECCAGILTGMGICIGAAIALVSFGPTVLLLYQKRCEQIRIGPKGKPK